jgi:hypothetical protein
MGPTQYAHHAVQSLLTRAGPNDRAGFIEAPAIGPAKVAANAT